MAVEHAVAAVAAREAGQGGHHDGAPFGEAVEERYPARQPAEAGEETEQRSVPLAPDPRGEAVDLHRGAVGFAHAVPPGRSLPFRFRRTRARRYSAASPGAKAEGAARSAGAMGFGHHRSSHSPNKP